MEGPKGIQLEATVGTTDRGSLWRATHESKHDRIVRIVEPRFCDGRFRQALTNLRQRQHSRMLEITGEGWSGGHFYIEYVVASPWRTLEERLAELASWRDRMVLLNQVCEVLARWQSSPVHPLGLNLRNIVVMRDAGRWYPWLAPCPAITVSSPCDLFGFDSTVVAALAPEVIRGAQLDERAQDAYALGTLVAQAIGCPESRLAAADDENRIEAQARGALLLSVAEGSRIPSFLHSTPQVQQLFQTIKHYRHTKPDARPHGATELSSAVNAVADPIALAGTLRSADPDRALEVLSWAGNGDEQLAVRAAVLAAEISTEAGDPQRALPYLDQAVSLAPNRLDLRRQRSESRWRVFKALPQGESSDREGELLLEDLALLTDPRLKHLDRNADSTLCLRAAEVHRRRGDPAAAAAKLFEAIKMDPSNLGALLSYMQCWIELGDRDNAEQTRTEALRRIAKLEKSQMLTTREAQQWREWFATFPY